MAYTLTRCRECLGTGITWTCGGRPEDRRRTLTCGRCKGSGEARVYVYPARRVLR